MLIYSYGRTSNNLIENVYVLHAHTYIKNEKCIRMGVFGNNINIFNDAKNITEEIEFKK